MNLIKSNKIEHRTMSDLVVEKLREAILNGELAGGQQLKQEALAGWLQVSLSPVREALKNLEAEGLVKFSPNRGVAVTALSAAEAREIFEIRLFLESGALELSIPYLQSADLTKAGQILQQADCAPASSDCGGLNWQFHQVLYQGADRPRLLSMIQILHNNVERYMRLYLATMNFHEQSQQEHRELLAACAGKDILQAQTVLRRHMLAASGSLCEYLHHGQG
ncbi:GntR family transcriptional regulator|nr:GntR family transcriptional regulator [Dendrosporobacter quercicolus DSM 1736]